MKKQYYLSKSSSFRLIITLYNDGIQVDQVKKWYGDELDEYLEGIESQGYTQGYSRVEVDKAEEKFRFFRDNLIEGV